jgi:hypothetical protein
LQILLHAVGIDHHAADNPGESAKHVVEGDEAVRQDHAFD